MNRIVLEGYIVISVMIAITDILLAIQSVKKNKTTGRFLGLACAAAALVDISYLISIISKSYLNMSIMSSVYFVGIDFMLVCLLMFTVYFTKGRFSKYGRLAVGFCYLYSFYELVIFAINPFKEIAIGYVERDTFIAGYVYRMKPLYYMHLVFSYSLVVIVLFLLVRKMCRIPREYRSQYSCVIIGIAMIVLVNGVFLFLPGNNVYNLLDYSICGYSLISFLIYWSCFNYSTHGMLNKLKTYVFENVGQGIVLFDYEEHLILHNERADYFLGEKLLGKCKNLGDFLAAYNLSANLATEDDSFSLQCYIRADNEERPLRCDVRRLDNEKGKKLGQMFVFSDIALETDMLTGFQKWESFKRLAIEEKDHFTFPVGVAICDINSLSTINSTLGNQAGDKEIRTLSDIIRRCFPERTYYVRGTDANLIALCSKSSEEEMFNCLSKVRKLYAGSIQYAVSVAGTASQNITDVIQDAARAMRAKKLVDYKSIHSDMLASLIRALEECDSDTEHHVRRTQRLGAELGKRIELTDIQQSKLALLCLLHDIGKIGVPMEILNKPGKLTDEEWKIMRSHVEKGYEIANSNTELKQIAEEVRHHHERWDGNGYPDGLSRESIPILSRVIAVVDAFDAMTNDRSYRKAMSIPKALEELKKNAGTQFDPYIVAEFIKLVSENYTAEDTEEDTEKVENTERRQLMGDSTDGENIPNTSNVHNVQYSRYLLDMFNNIISVDDNFEALTGYTREDVEKGMNQQDLIPEEERTEYLCQTAANLAKSTFVFQEHRIRRKNGSDICVLCYGRKFYDSAIKEDRMEIIITDISKTYSMKVLTDVEQNKAEARLRNWESTYRSDSLTGLLNHAAFRNDMEMKLLAGDSIVMMIMMDVDRFKQYNDTYGHHNGDKYLVLVAQALLMSLRDEDYACRMGGDEFAAMLFFGKNIPDKAIRERAQQIFDKVNLTVKSAEGSSGISMGAVIAKTEVTFNQLYEESDNALYSAKEKGRGRIVVVGHGQKA